MIFQRGTEFHDVVHSFSGEADHPISVAGDIFKDSLAGQNQQCLPHGSLADMIALHQRLLVKNLFSLKLSADNPVDNFFVNLFL